MSPFFGVKQEVNLVIAVAGAPSGAWDAAFDHYCTIKFVPDPV